MVQCNICGEDFARKDILSRHLKRKYPCGGSKLRLKGNDFPPAPVIKTEEDSKIAKPLIPSSGTKLTEGEKELFRKYNSLLRRMIQRGEDNGEEMCRILDTLDNCGIHTDDGLFDKISYTCKKYCS